MSGRQPSESRIDIAAIVAEYAPANSDDDTIRAIKEAVAALPAADVRILCLYAHTASYRKTAAMLGVSKRYVADAVRAIRETIKAKLP